MVDELKSDVQVDVRDFNCPMPLIKTQNTMKTLKPGQVLEVLTTDPTATKSVPTYAKKSGHEWLGMIEDEEGFFRLFIKKN